MPGTQIGSRLRRALRRAGFWLRPDDVADEVSFHREMIERDLIARGVSPTDARRAARRQMGNETYMREEAREVWTWPSLAAAWQDATHAARSLRRTPTFAIGVTLTLGLGIGANTAMFSLIDRMLFRPPARLINPASVHRVYLYRTSDGRETQTGGQYVRFTDLARWSTSMSMMAAYGLRPLAVGVGEGTRIENVAIVTAGFFDFFDAKAVVGRYFTPAEDAPPSPAAVAVLSYSGWKTRFGGRTDIVGSRVQIDAVVYTIIGIAPEGFVGLWPYRPPVAFVPVTTYAAARGRRSWATNYGTGIGIGILARRKAGVSVAAASADLTNTLRRSYQKQRDESQEGPSLDELRPRAVAGSVLTERGPEPSSVTRAAKWLSGVTIIVLLIACANVVNLVLARAIRRRRETAVRVALGVSRRRLVGQFLTEGVVLATLGGIAGIGVALWASGVLSAIFLPGTERVGLLTDWRTLGFAFGIALMAGLLAGLSPLAQLRRVRLNDDLMSGGRSGVHQRSALRTTLLLLQSALSVILLVGAGLFVQSLRNVRNVHLGFDADAVLDIGINMRDVKLDSATMVALRRRLLEAATTVPGVTHATLHEATPFNGMSSWPIFIDGMDSTTTLGRFDFNAVSSDYFATMGTRILRGRGIEATDVGGAPRAAVVGQSMANVLWPGQEPIGRCIHVGAANAPCTYVVGVAEDIRSESIEPESRLFFYYMSAAQWQPNVGGLFVRGHDAAALIEPVRRRLQREMPGSSFVSVGRLGDYVDAKMRSWIVGATLFTVFGALALVLAAVGLYSVIAYDVTQRRHELGVRLALGAGQQRVVALVVRQGVSVTMVGVAIGSVVALLAGQAIGPLLFEQSPRDVGIFTLAIVTMLLVSVAASAIPARRAAMVDPKTALQSD